MDQDKETIDVYNAKAQDYAKLTDTAAPNAHLRAFLASLPFEPKVLDLGCGTGAASDVMRKRGCDVTSIDASKEMAAIAKKKYGIKVQIGTFKDVKEVAIYDGVWASFSLLHAPRKDMLDHLKAIHKSLKKNGLFVIGLKTGRGEKRDSLGRLYTYYEMGELSMLLNVAGFTLAGHKTGSEVGLDGVDAPFIIMTTRA